MSDHSYIHLDKRGENVVIKVGATDEDDFAVMMVALIHSAAKSGAFPRIMELYEKSNASTAVDLTSDAEFLH